MWIDTQGMASPPAEGGFGIVDTAMGVVQQARPSGTPIRHRLPMRRPTILLALPLNVSTVRAVFLEILVVA